MPYEQCFFLDHLRNITRIVLGSVARGRLESAAMSALVDALDAKARGKQLGHGLEHMGVRRDAMQA